MERLRTLIGKELTSSNLHEAIFSEIKHQKILRRFNVGSHSYIDYQIKKAESDEEKLVVDIKISGNPNTFRMGLEENDEVVIIASEPRISYSYL